MNVLSLFDGMSCGRIALERAGMQVSKYYASELDKYAIKVTQANWPETIQLGDVTKWREWDIDWSSIDLLIGGSPCQGFSFAGKQLAFDDPRSKLFFVYSDILTHIDAERDKAGKSEVKFLLENVKMKKDYLEIISDQLGVKPVFINSALVSAQNRQRYYWSNWDFEQPEDKGIQLIDILEDEPFDKTIMSERFTNRNKTAGCLRDDYNKDIKTTQRIEVRTGDKTNCLTSVQKDNYIVRSKSKCIRVGGVGSPPDSRQNWDNALESKVNYRKLTPIECERLQTVPGNYTNHVSNTQRYKMLGNGWTVDVIAHIFKGLITEPHPFHQG